MDALLPVIWFVLVGVLLTGYAVLDGFDLGAGALHLLTRRDAHRRACLNAIGPVWDGNEVWLVTGGGALFAAFPEVYATIFSGFYLAMILLLMALIFRATAIECRSRLPGAGWRRFWDASFCVASAAAAILLGCALGNLVRGVPLDARHEYTGGLPGLLNPHGLLSGVAALALVAFHGALYLNLKTEGELQAQVRSWLRGLFLFAAVALAALTAWAILREPHVFANFHRWPALWAVPMLAGAALLGARACAALGRDLAAFLCSCGMLLLLMATAFIAIFPNLVPSLLHPENSLTIHNAASSPLTQRIMLVIAGIGMPLALAYTAMIYWIFRRRVKAEPDPRDGY